MYVSKHSHWTSHNEDRHQGLEYTLVLIQLCCIQSHMNSKLFSFILVSSKKHQHFLTKDSHSPCFSSSLIRRNIKESLARLLFLHLVIPSPSILSLRSKKTGHAQHQHQANMQTSFQQQQQQQRESTPLSLWLPESRATTTKVATTTSTNTTQCCLRNLCELEINIHPDTIAALAEDIRLYDVLSAGDESGMHYPPSFLFFLFLVLRT